MKKSKKPATRRSKSATAPTRFQQFGQQYPTVMDAYTALGKATQEVGPLDQKERALAKLGIAIGAWREGAVHSHTRRAIEAGCTAADVRHVVLLATTTLGFPSMMAAMTWVDDVLDRR
jgi:alkylhydroperoxidase/carboxymuconolactone decarboxylase family protein YurZ